jgi:hypothetical protein
LELDAKGRRALLYTGGMAPANDYLNLCVYFDGALGHRYTVLPGKYRLFRSFERGHFHFSGESHQGRAAEVGTLLFSGAGAALSIVQNGLPSSPQVECACSPEAALVTRKV